ncbi:glutamate 5-kinase [Thiolapillus sp.]
MLTRNDIPHTRRWVVKIGSALLTAEGRGLDRQALGRWVDQMADWLEQGHELVLVSSGAVAEGMCRMGWSRRPDTLHELQAAAAIGQMGLVQAWESCFQRRGRHTAQVLVTHDDLSNRKRYLNARSTLQTLLSLGVVPVVNENDVVANEELRFGDNDTLAALVANLIEADLLILLTDQNGLFDADPRISSDARLIEHARVDDARLDVFAGDSRGNLGSGGMQTKLRAARLAARSGTATIIASGKEQDALRDIAAGKELGTLLVPAQEPDAARKRWLAAQLQARGKLVLDDGAVRMLQQSGSSLLSVGVSAVEGQFSRGEMVACVDTNGREVARGLVNYSSDESRKIAGQPSGRFEKILGYIDDEELIHRDNLVVL